MLIEFLPEANWGWDFVTIKDELEQIFKRRVDLVTKNSVLKSQNPIRKKAILDSYEVIDEHVV